MSSLVRIKMETSFNLDDEGSGAANRVTLLAMFPDRLESGPIRLGAEVVYAVETVGQGIVGAEV
jgi:hypothetical protein